MREATDVDAIQELLGVHGIGPVKAKALLKAGIKSVRDLRAATTDLLTTAQTLGLKHYEDGLERIPRAEMATHEGRLLSLLPSALRGVVVGSYRRGAHDSGDVDLLITYDPSVSAKAASTAFQAYVQSLQDTSVVFDALVSGPKKWMGYTRLPGGKARRLDLLLTPPAEFGFAVLYFTGSDRFNVAMRAYANTKGLTLNEHGFNLEPKDGIRGTLPEMPLLTEASIFAFLRLTYIPPTERVDGRQILPLP
jgi:DNA polymerase/3'-5' exonuclease PolX